METTSYYQPLFNYLSNQHGVHMLESDMSEIINIVKQMKNKERIAFLKTEISRLKVANQNNIYRIEAIESHLAEQHKGANFNPKPPECVADNEVGNIRAGIKIHKGNLDTPITPDFIPDWKDAPDWAKYKAMNKDGAWNWYSGHPFISGSEWLSDLIENKYKLIPNHPPSDKPWNKTLEARPEAESDYTHLLPDGYEFCSEEDATEWVKVREIPEKIMQSKVGLVGYTDGRVPSDKYKPYWLPIRPIQYKVTTHEIVNAVPDPYQPDWSQAPEGTVAHAWDANEMGYWYLIGQGVGKFWHQHKPSPFPPPPGLDWKQSLRVKPSK